jgi:DNA gyrase subunit A
VRGIRLAADDSLASMDVVISDAQLLVVTRNGYGKRTPLSAYAVKGRGIGGVRAIKTTSKTGPVAAARVVKGYEELMMISAGGMVVRTAIETISERTGRLTSGVKLMNVRDGDRLAAIAILEPSTNGGGDEGESVVVDDDGVVIETLPTETADDLEDETELEDEEDAEADSEPDEEDNED